MENLNRTAVSNHYNQNQQHLLHQAFLAPTDPGSAKNKRAGKLNFQFGFKDGYGFAFDLDPVID